jgi:hypothetical protein
MEMTELATRRTLGKIIGAARARGLDFMKLERGAPKNSQQHLVLMPADATNPQQSWSP